MDVLTKKSIVLSVRMRFSPEAQPLRELAIERILEQNMLVADADKGLSIHEIEQLCDIYLDKRLVVFGRKVIENAIQRMKQKGRLTVVASSKGSAERYILSQATQKEAEAVSAAAQIRNQKVVERLFSRVANSGQYAQPFFECIASIFSKLGEAYVRLLKGDISPKHIVSMPDIDLAVKAIAQRHAKLDMVQFRTAIDHFLLDQDPDYDIIKWNMSQNYFIAKSIGLNASDVLLSQELFSNSTLYLDTNVIIDALEPSARHHKSLIALFDACRRLGITLQVCRISLHELARVVRSRIDALERIGEKIPTEFSKRIHDPFYRVYYEATKGGTPVDIEKLFQNFNDAKQILQDDYLIEEVDDLWFDAHAEMQHTLQLASIIRTKHKHYRPKSKSKSSSLHDALILDWVRERRHQDSNKVWLVTLDTSLPDEAVLEKSGQPKSCIVTLDALLQWISPIAITEGSSEQVSAVFSEAIRNQLLPQDNLFTINDFLVFAGMEWDVKEMPTQDVEDCISYFRTSGPDLNPDDPVDREKIAHELSRFFVDPGRKYKEELSELQGKLTEHQKDSEKKIARIQQVADSKDDRIGDLERILAENLRIQESGKARRIARWKMLLSATPSLIIEATSLYLANSMGQGDNVLQKILSFWPFLTFGIAVFPILCWFVVGKKGLISLGWPFDKMTG